MHFINLVKNIQNDVAYSIKNFSLTLNRILTNYILIFLRQKSVYSNIMKAKLIKNNRSIFLLIVIIVILISFYVRLLPYQPTINNTIADNKNQDSGNLKSSGYWNLTNSYIYIDDNGLNGITWAEAESEPWCSGSGTWGDPYIIENVINYDTGMMGGGSAVASISIKYSEKPFIIRNCTLLNSHDGIELYAVKHGTLINNTLSGNINGIRLGNSENITMRDNILNNNAHGIYSLGSDNNYRIINNTIFYNYVAGISLRSAININITDNKMIGIGDYINNMAGGVWIWGGRNLIIKNNIIVNSSDEGIVFLGGAFNNNNQIFNNVIKGSGTQGIYTDDSNRLIIWNNTIIDSIDCGIQIEKSTYGNNNTISNNSIIGSGINGIYTLDSSDNIISNNSIINSGSNGIYIQEGANNIISNNNASDNNLDGLVLFYTSYNNISNNIFFNNTKSGTKIDYSDFNQLWKNQFINNVLYGVKMVGSWSVNNILYQNYFIGNTQNTYDSGSFININYWNKSNIGNFWDDYLGEDYNDDEIGDTPYEINTIYTTGVMDYWPIWDDGPTIIVKSPQNNDVYSHPPSYVVECYDPGLDMMWYTVNHSNIKYFIFDNGSIDFDIWKDLSEGNVSLRFYGNDTDGYIYFKEIMVVKDNSSPIITIFAPLNGSLFGINAPTFNISIIDPALNLKWYTLNDGNLTYIFSNSTGTINQSAWESVPEGNVNITFYANDLAGSSSFEVLTLTKDISPPQINVISPKNGVYCNITAPNFTVRIDDLNLASMWYTIDNGIHNISFSTNFTINQAPWETIWNASSHNGVIIIRIYAKDHAENLNFEDISLIKFAPNEENENDESPVDNAILGYELTILFSVILGTSLILIKKLKSNRKFIRKKFTK